MLAIREVVRRFWAYVAVIVPLPVPDGVTVHHDWLLVVVQEAFEVTVNGVVPAGAGTFWFDGVTARVSGAAACVTVTTTGVRPLTLTVTFATRDVVRGFCV